MTTDLVPISHYEPIIEVTKVIWRSKKKIGRFYAIYDPIGKLIDNQRDIEPEFVDIVNDNLFNII